MLKQPENTWSFLLQTSRAAQNIEKQQMEDSNLAFDISSIKITKG